MEAGWVGRGWRTGVGELLSGEVADLKDPSCDSLHQPEMRIKAPVTRFARSSFQKVSAKVLRSGNVPFVMSQRAITLHLYPSTSPA